MYLLYKRTAAYDMNFKMFTTNNQYIDTQYFYIIANSIVTHSLKINKVYTLPRG